STSSRRGLGDCVGICASGTTFLTTSARSLSLTTAWHFLRRLYPPSHCAPARRALGSHGCPSQVANQLTGQPARSQARLSSPTSPYCGPRLRRGAHSCRILREGGHQDEASGQSSSATRSSVYKYWHA